MTECQDSRCTRVDGKCVGMHCSYCGEPCSSQGHPKCYDAAGDAAMARALERAAREVIDNA